MDSPSHIVLTQKILHPAGQGLTHNPLARGTVFECRAPKIKTAGGQFGPLRPLLQDITFSGPARQAFKFGHTW